MFTTNAHLSIRHRILITNVESKTTVENLKYIRIYKLGKYHC